MALLSNELSNSAGYAASYGSQEARGRYQVRIFGGTDPVTGQQVMLSGSAATQTAAMSCATGSAPKFASTPPSVPG